MAALAAAQASEENMRVRCGECDACLANTGTPRRCLVMRACAAAAAGHSGAQVCRASAFLSKGLLQLCVSLSLQMQSFKVNCICLHRLQSLGRQLLEHASLCGGLWMRSTLRGWWRVLTSCANATQSSMTMGTLRESHCGLPIRS